MDYALTIFLVLAFVTGVFLIEGIYLLWNERRGPEAQRLEQRLHNVAAGGAGTDEAKRLLKRGNGQVVPLLERLVLSMPRLGSLDKFIAQSGSELSVSFLVGLCLLFCLIGFAASYFFLKAPLWFSLLISCTTLFIPYAFLTWKRARRFTQMERMMPEAVDLIARAMQAGHGFNSALQMVSDELTGPLAEEFSVLSDELNFGLPPETAFGNLARRIPTDDIRFFVIAVLLQRETGGNLVEILKNISKLVRERMALFGKVRVLAAEGKMSVWVLTGMPIVTTLLIQAVNPKFLSVLFTDPQGINLVYGAVFGMIIGVIWMLNVVKIRV
jgi:tight adherence protein B